jgi:hypothetical protein
MESLANFLGGGIKCNHNINKHITQALAVLPYITSKAKLKVAAILLITKYNDDMSVEKSGRGESQNRFSPQLGKDARKSAFSLRHLDAYHAVCEEKRTEPAHPRIEIRNFSIYSNKKR